MLSLSLCSSWGGHIKQLHSLIMSRNTDFSDGKGVMSGEGAILNSIIKKGFLDFFYEQRCGFDEGESYVTI